MRALGAALLLVVSGQASAGQATDFRGFADVTFDAGGGPTGSQFALGQYDLFTRSRLSDRVTFLSEIVFEAEDREFIVDIERVEATFEMNPHLSFTVGRQHAPIGYWNTTFHHGSVFEPTIDRPLMFLFEDEGGVLPIHVIGLRASGRDIGGAHLGYDVMIGNGIGSSAVEDNDSKKAISADIFAQVTPFLRLGSSIYMDHLSQGIETLTGTPLAADARLTMAGPSIVYESGSVEFLGEYLRIWNRTEGMASTSTSAGYLYAGYHFGQVVPYARYDFITYPDADSYYPTDDMSQAVIGLRYDLAALAVLKGEARWLDSDSTSSSTRFFFQIAVGF